MRVCKNRCLFIPWYNKSTAKDLCYKLVIKLLVNPNATSLAYFSFVKVNISRGERSTYINILYIERLLQDTTSGKIWTSALVSIEINV